MGDGTNYVIEQLGLALKSAEENYQKLLEHAQSQQNRIAELESREDKSDDVEADNQKD